MSSEQSASEPPRPMTTGSSPPFANRYALGEELGRGGMAVVHTATDAISGRAIAIKRLHQRDDGAAHSVALSLFEQEYHVLSELAHPNVVAVHDYGIADAVPYYTMELLDGGDLAQLSPMPPEQACRVFRDVCSALALLHSRRLVYRDLNPRNVRCTRSGVAKLIDFGAMVPMGPVPKLIGTVGYLAPEVLHQQSLDGRADLYAVGACLYYALTGRAPHRARSFAELLVVVQVPPPRPSQVLAGQGALEIPAALDELVMELLQVDPAFRPASAAEVIERLTTIGQLPDDERQPVAGAYLVTPPLVGRDRQLSKVRQRLTRLAAGVGAAMLFEAPAGAGRSRVLEAAVLEAKLAGFIAVRADAGDALSGDYGVANALADQLFDLHPDAHALAEPHASVLGHVLTSVRRAYPAIDLAAFDDVRNRRPAVQAALKAWLLSLARARALVVAVDDMHRIDEPSLAFLALVAAETRRNSLLLFLTSEQGTGNAMRATFSAVYERAKVVSLNNLASDDTRALLAATFGESAKLSLLSARIFSVCHGNPRDVMQLAQFVVSQGIVRYEGGRWLLPQKLDANLLPRSTEEASLRVFMALSEPARDLARLLSVCALPALSFEDCLHLRRTDDRASTMRLLGELAAADVVRVAEARYSLSRPMWAQAALSGLANNTLCELHRRLADLMATRSHPPLLRMQHLQRAGENERAMTEMVAFCRESIQETDGNTDAYHALVESLPPDWYTLFDQAIATAQACQRPLTEVCVLRQRLLGLLGLDPTVPSTHAAALLSQLRSDVGLDLYAELSEAAPDAPPGELLQQMLARAQARYDEAPEARFLAPLSAIRTLVQSEIAAAGLIIPCLDYGLLAQLPNLQPIEAVAPAIALTRALIDGLTHRMAGQVELTQADYAGVLERIGGADHGGIDPTHAAYAQSGVIRALGILDAGIGHDRALTHADTLAKTPLLALQAGFIRMLYYYFDARPQEGDALKREMVLASIGASGTQWHEGSHLTAEVVAHALAQDATRLRETLRELEVHAGRHVGWQPVLHYAEAELWRLQGKHAQARKLLEGELEQIGAGQHQQWCNLAGAHVATLCDLGQPALAVAHGERYLAEAQAAKLGVNEVYIRLPLAAARRAMPDLDGAARDVEALIALLSERGVRGLLLGAACELAALVALEQAEPEQARTHVQACEAHLRADHNRVGRIRCERLRRALGDLTGDESDSHTLDIDRMQSQIRSEILRTHQSGFTGGAWHAALLQRVLDETRAEAAALFVRTRSEVEPHVAVEIGAGERLDRMQTLASACYTRQDAATVFEDGDDFATQTQTGDPTPQTDADDMEAFALGHTEDQTLCLSGVVVLAGAHASARPQLLEAVSRLLQSAPPALTSDLV